MRKAGPILIVLIGVLALIINFFPNLTLPDSSSPTGSRPIETKLGLDLSGGLRVEYQAQKVDGKSPTAADMAIIKDIIERRVNTTGVSEPVVVTQGDDRVVVELPGVTNPDAVRQLVGQTGRLDFVPLGATGATEGQVLDLTKTPPLFSGDQVSSASIGQDQSGGLTVNFVLKEDGANRFADFTGKHVGEYFAITLDSTVISAPRINEAIPGGNVQITAGGIGGFPAAEANNLVTILKFGSLPFPIVELSSERISATLGSQFLNQSLLAGALGILMVMTFMVIYYRAIGLIACFALAYYTLVVVAIFRLIPVTLTLAGIAGFVLSIGMAVDANILIFERMKEELRLGKSLPAAVEAGFNRAWNSILDSNVSSLITAGILYAFGSSTIRGFALVLIIGVLVSMFSAIVVTRSIMRVMVRQGWAKHASFYGLRGEEFVTREPMGRPAAELPSVFDVIGKRRWFYAISLILTIPGLVFILLTPFTNAGLQFSIDYTGGTRWEIKFEDPNVTPDQVEAVFAEHGLEATALTTGSGFIEIRTVLPVGLQPQAPQATPVPTLALPSATPSGSPGASTSPSASAGSSAAPSASPSAAPSASPSPAPSASPSGSASPSASPSAAPAGTVELPTTGPLGEVRASLEEELGPIVAQNSLTTIGAVVSSDLVTQALILILVGSIGILLWITYRFRDVKFGVTALVALLHDVILVVGFFALLGTFFGVQIDALFVTAMLTIIGFSVHDTIVVFDRVRENRARHAGEPFGDIVNHSILQTFGRSITTSLTVVLTLLALLLFGGSAINDFILALLIGIVSGTYSSIFVASPLLVDWHLWEDRRHGRVATTRAPRTKRSVS